MVKKATTKKIAVKKTAPVKSARRVIKPWTKIRTEGRDASLFGALFGGFIGDLGQNGVVEAKLRVNFF